MKSQALRFYEAVTASLIRDMHTGTVSGVPLKRDLETLSRRVNSEGLHFLTSVLPNMGKCLDRALETRRLTSIPFFKNKNGTNLPCFMHEQFRRIFRKDGILLDHPDEYSIQEIRQVCFCFYKLETPFKESQLVEAKQKYLDCEKDLSSHSFSSCDESVVFRAQKLLKILFKNFDPKDIIPGHGPGSVCTGEKGNEKWSFSRLYNHAHQCYPWYEYFLSSFHGRGLVDRVSWYRNLDRLERAQSKVCFVPKDSRGPRTISIEPLEIQYLQQGLMKSMVRLVEKHPLTRGFVNFTDQSINQSIALSSSMRKDYATIDLKEASDRVHINLVRILFPDDITEHLLALRSQSTKFPDGDSVELRKFAPMGSALCFPVLALSIWALTRAYLDVNCYHDDCFVYGDDLIIPSDTFAGIKDMLESFAFKLNSEKSYVVGFFRESCGVDAYNGVNVTPIRMSKPWSGKSRDSRVFQSLTAFREHMFNRGFWHTAREVQRWTSALYGKIPYGCGTSGFPCIPVTDPFVAERLNERIGVKMRWNSNLQRKEFLVRTFVARDEKSDLQSWERVLKGLLKPSLSDPTRVVFRQERILSWKWSPI